MEVILGLLPIFGLLFFYIVPAVFVIWFIFKFLNIQQEKLQILKSISDKLDKRSN